MTTLRHELAQLVNRYSHESVSDTPDFILAEYLETCLDAFDSATVARERWYGRPVGDGAAIRKVDSHA